MAFEKIDLLAVIPGLGAFVEPAPVNFTRPTQRAEKNDLQRFLNDVDDQIAKAKLDQDKYPDLVDGDEFMKDGTKQKVPKNYPTLKARGKREKWYRMQKGAFLTSLYLGNLIIGEPVKVVGGWSGLIGFLEGVKNHASDPAREFDKVLLNVRSASKERRKLNAERRASSVAGDTNTDSTGSTPKKRGTKSSNKAA